MELARLIAATAALIPIVHGAPSTPVHPEMMAAMKRDLGQDAAQTEARVAREVVASNIVEELRTSTGDSFAGAWLSEDGTVNIGITNEALLDTVTSAGASPVILATSLSKLDAAKAAVDNLDISQPLVFGSTEAAEAAAAATGIASYYVDVESNKLVFEALSGSIAHAEALAREVGLNESEFEIRTIQESDLPSTYVTVGGGDAYWINRSRTCNVGFTVTTGFLTAGHCGSVGDTVSATKDGEIYGTFSGSSFPGRDWAYVRTVSGTVLLGTVNGIPISGSTPAPVGASVCHKGRTTGIICGTIRARGVTVNYAEGRVTGLVSTNACAEPGDSGGPWYSGSQAQGVTSGGSGSCTTGAITYFAPVNEILAAYGLTLVRG